MGGEEKKRDRIVILVVWLSGMDATLGIHAQNTWIPFSAETPQAPAVELQTSVLTGVLFRVEVPGIVRSPQAVDGTVRDRIGIPDHQRTSRPGYPELPVLVVLLAVPECTGLELQVLPRDSVELDGLEVCPAPRLVEKADAEGRLRWFEEYVPNDTVYKSQSYFPEFLGRIAEVGYVREQRVARVEL